jgi:hypothetical protein
VFGATSKVVAHFNVGELEEEGGQHAEEGAAGKGPAENELEKPKGHGGFL